MQLPALRTLFRCASRSTNLVFFLFLSLACVSGTLLLTACTPVNTTEPTTQQQATSATNTGTRESSTTENPSQTPKNETPALVTGKTLNTVHLSTNESPRNDGIHDPTNAGIAMLQNPSKAMKDFPRDRRQQIDWGQALDQGLIKPRADLMGKTEMPPLDLDIVMKNTQSMPWVKFSHLKHSKWLACDNCHPAIFEPKKDANPITMNKVLRGEYCGVCHDTVAFSLMTCERCHSLPHEGSGPKWW